MSRINEALNVRQQEPLEMLCIFPVVQQVIGISGALLCLAKLVGNYAKRCFNEVKYDPSNQTNLWSAMGCASVLVIQGVNYESKKSNLLSNLSLNILRAIPIVGTAISLERHLTSGFQDIYG